MFGFLALPVSMLVSAQLGVFEQLLVGGAGRDGRPSLGAISTGTIALSTAAFGNSCRRHRNSWLLFTSWRRATIDTEAPGAWVSATIRRFSAARSSGRLSAVIGTPAVDQTYSRFGQ